ncbi:LysR family transcriptional regulator [Neisseria sp. HMSC31F04]|uniref:LysR family transcriptional regulator n=1 Tax=Neisseria sp. HMSC31F04 TaxID=1581075 RepID=UPI0008A1B172|nr:LysR family transcriptional regulator [Neisseria sp. HMSC31F04]OFT04578.1 LysR family transcriptional regulator [Neisseria sp. HMSC31F04]
MDTLFSLKVFREVVRQGSFTRAADKLGISTAMASKHISHLENHIGAKLLQRNSRNLYLTEAGAEYHRECGYALETLETAAERAAGGTEKPQGLLRVTMPMWFANHHVCSWLAEYCRLYPAVSLDLILDNRKIDLVAEGVDLALRVSSVDLPPTLIVRPLSEIAFYLIGETEYLQRHGTPATPQEILTHNFVQASYVDMEHIKISRDGEHFNLTPNSTIRADNTPMVREMVLAGGGLGYLPAWTVKRDLDSGRLVRLLPEWRIPSATLYAAYADRAFLSAKIRSFIDFLVEKSGRRPSESGFLYKATSFR